MPPELKFKGKYSKYIFRKSVNGLLPKHVLEYPKHGFNVPMEKWGRTIWLDELCKMSSEIPEIEKIIDFSNIDNWDGSLIWNMLFLSRWLSSFHFQQK
jgi:asparagine synthetase B (glutamine-hydrolysing)